MVLDLESVVLEQEMFGYVYGGLGESKSREEIISICNCNKNNRAANWGSYYSCSYNHNHNYNSAASSSSVINVEAPAGRRGLRKRRRVKNSEEIENQRMTHIAVERNRRKQMNEYLSVLRSIMPSSYTQRGDQASIVGGTIKFVKELEQLLQCLEAHKQKQNHHPSDHFISNSGHDSANSAAPTTVNVHVTLIDNYANIKMMAENRPKQLLKLLLLEFHSLQLFILHITVTTLRQIVLYCFTVKIEDDCKLGTVSEITAAVNEIFRRIHMEKFD